MVSETMKINVILKKEDIDPLQITNNHIVVVLDILLATSTIVSILHAGAKEVYPVVDKMEALSMSEDMFEKSPILIGEENGQLIDGFLAPTPLSLHATVKNRTAILSTTNGTVAIRTVSHAKKVYIASLLNGVVVARRLVKNGLHNESVNIICSGSSNQFCMEDFYGAGYLINELKEQSDDIDIHLSDSAKSAWLFYSQYATKEAGEQILRKSSVGEMLIKQGFSQDISYVSKQGKYRGIPELNERKIVMY